MHEIEKEIRNNVPENMHINEIEMSDLKKVVNFFEEIHQRERYESISIAVSFSKYTPKGCSIYIEDYILDLDINSPETKMFINSLHKKVCVEIYPPKGGDRVRLSFTFPHVYELDDGIVEFPDMEEIKKYERLVEEFPDIKNILR